MRLDSLVDRRPDGDLVHNILLKYQVRFSLSIARFRAAQNVEAFRDSGLKATMKLE
jgi:hypothetical protein